MRHVIATSALALLAAAAAGTALTAPASAGTAAPPPDRTGNHARPGSGSGTTTAQATRHRATDPWRRAAKRPGKARRAQRQGAAPGSGATGSAAGRAARPRSVLTLSRSAGDASSRSNRFSATLACEPSGGSHPKASQACADLLRSDGVFEQPPSDLVCPMIFSPVTVTAAGLWRGKTVHFQATYGNECIMRSRTGTVFGF